MSGSSPMPCPVCGSELSIYPKNPTTGHPCPFCGYIGFAALPASLREWFSTHTVNLGDVKYACVVVKELLEFMAEEGIDHRTQFAARLALEEAVAAAMRRSRDG